MKKFGLYSPGGHIYAVIKKGLIIMKITLLLILISTFNLLATDTYSQTARVSLNLNQISLKQTLKEIERSSEFYFLYNNELVDVERKVDINADNEQINTILDHLFANQDVKYAVYDRQIVISPINMPLPQEVQRKISGKVIDSSGGALPGVTVVVKGTTNGTITSANGNYLLSNIPDNATLQFSFVGMKSQDIAVGNKTAINVTLAEETVGIEEVVAIGYGTQKKESLTGAISNIVSKEIQTTSASSLAQKLSGKVVGLNIRQNNGEPGNFANSINIRGFGEPLYVIDGIARGGSADFQRLNSEDIESISILKDASAAIYGLNAANGVIIVTTKKGSSGKTKFTLATTSGFSTPTDIPAMANAAQYYEMRNDANINAGLAPFISKEELAKWKEGGPGYESTNWADETFRKYAVRREHNLSAQGGNDKVAYYVNAGAVDEGSILRSNDLNYNKFNFRSNLTAKLTKNLTANINITGFIDKKTEPVQGIFSIWRGTVSALPINTPYANDNPEYLRRVQDGQSMNPVAISQIDLTGYNERANTTLQTSIDLTYKVPFIDGLELKGVAAYDSRFETYKNLSKNFDLYDYKVEDDSYVPTSFNKPASIFNHFNNSHYLTIQAHAIYKTTIADKHNLGATVVYEQKDQAGRYASILKYYDFYTNDQIDQAGEKNASSSGNEWQVRSMSFLGRLNYDYMGKYLIEFAARYDGSYRYHPDVRWGLFPVITGGWRVSEENFMKEKVQWLSNLKIRGSYGTIGQDAGAPFQFVQGFSTTGGGRAEFVNGILTNGAATPSIVNEKLTWMESNIKDIGIDVGFFENKLSLTADLYQRDRTGLLAYRNVSLPNTFGGTLPQENLNSDRVRGMEFSFAYRNTIGELSYNVKGNINFARTMNVYIESAPFTSSWSKYRGGASNRWSDIVWTYNKIDQFQTNEEILNAPIQNGNLGNQREIPGDFKYEDLNGDGVIDGNDISPNFYNESPKTNFGFSLDATWKGFDLSVLFQGAANFTVRRTHAYTTMFWAEGNLPAYFMDRWHLADPYNPASEWIPGEWPASRANPNNIGMLYEESGVWRRSASYLRFKNIELGYSFKQAVLHKIGIDKIRVFSNMSNVYTWADQYVKPFDPESVSGSYAAGWNYPLSRTVNIGVSVDF